MKHLLLITLLLSLPLQAQELSNQIEVDMTKLEVVELIGSPDKVIEPYGELIIETWHYFLPE